MGHVAAAALILPAIGGQARAIEPPLKMTFATQFGTTGNDAGPSLRGDDAGRLFIAATTNGSFGGPNAGDDDLVYGVLDTKAQFQVLKQIGTPKRDTVHTSAPDGAGGSFAVAITEGDLAGPHQGGLYDIWVGRWSPTGTLLWQAQYGSFGNEVGSGIAVNPIVDGFFTAGYCYDGTFGGPWLGGTDAMIAKIDENGAMVWASRLGTASNEYINDVAPDLVDGVFVCGQTDGSWGGPNLGFYDSFVAHVRADGSLAWLSQFGTASHDISLSVQADGLGGVLAAGYTGGSLAAPNQGFNDVVVARYNKLGQQVWVRQFGSSGSDSLRSLLVDPTGAYFLTGFTDGSLGGPNAGAWDIWLAKFEPSGTQLWIQQFGTSFHDVPSGMAFDGSGGLWLGGNTRGSFAASNPNPGTNDIIITRFQSSCYADCDGDGALSIDDFICFQTLFALGC